MATRTVAQTAYTVMMRCKINGADTRMSTFTKLKDAKRYMKHLSEQEELYPRKFCSFYIDEFQLYKFE